MKIVISDYAWPNIDIERNFFINKSIDLDVSSGKEDLIDKIKDADGLLFCFEDINEDVLRSAKNLKAAQRYGIGVDNINIKVATELGIVVSNIPDYCIDEVSDHALSMILAINRMIVPDSKMVKLGKWNDVKKNNRVFRLTDATLGIIGFGRIGRRLANKAKALGLKVIAYDPYINEQVYDGVNILPFDDVVSSSDILSLHVPLTKETNHLISYKELEKMKDNTILINVSRGGLIDEKALSEYLKSGKVRGVGMDVMEDHNPSSSNPLFEYENVIVTPHTAFFSQESSEELQIRSCEQLYGVLNGNKPKFLINPEVLNHPDVNLT
ncbi:MAG: hydroxyacid dehydrogenase [Chloroflexi bacterium]|nr:hydroxyacid dehydrogenase [Chloroflexota bacterium]|tara:strand:+ start:2266 stop:3240 length:975 start_codon:yes stop_codon:yes gene_type:complete